MHETLIIKASQLSDDALLAHCQHLAAHARETTAELIAHLAEVDRRRLYRGKGPGSLYGYCRQVLLMSEHAAYHRMKVARVVIAFPSILDLLADGAVTLTTVRLLAPHLTAESHRGLLTEAIGKSRRDVEKIVAGLAPQPDAKSSVRKLPAPRAIPAPLTDAPLPTGECAQVALGMGDPVAAELPTEQAAPGVPASSVRTPAAHWPVVLPTAPARYRVQFTIDEETESNLRRAQDLLRREVPDGDPAVIFARALRLLLGDVEKKKLAATEKPRQARPATPGSRTIPAHVRRAVARRDAGQCAFAAPNGRRCTERSYLEFHHVHPFARGGGATVENIALRCRTHNAYESELVFGPRQRPANSVRTELKGGLPDFARTPFAAADTHARRDSDCQRIAARIVNEASVSAALDAGR